MADAERQPQKGDRVTCDVEWPNGRVVNMTGTLIAVVGDDAYLETDAGAVAGRANTLELA